MTIYQILCLLGVPTIFLAFLKIVFSHIKSIKLGVQALLRAQMISEFNKWSERKYAPIYARQNFENCWQQYHSLGANGVMDDIRTKILALPIEPPEEVDK